MINKIQKGDRIKVTATIAVASGDFVLIGTIPAVAMTSAGVGEQFIADLNGVFELPKATGAVTQGATLYWDATAKDFTTTATGNTEVGPAFEAAASTDSTVLIRLV